MENMDRINVQKRDRAYKWRYQLYRKLFYSSLAVCLMLLVILVWKL